jgi:hypothetical protein
MASASAGMGREYTCKRCGGSWRGKETPPRHCYHCTSELWNVAREKFTCKRCGHTWQRVNRGKPKTCMGCGSPCWDRDDLRWMKCWCGNRKDEHAAVCGACLERLPEVLRAKLPVGDERHPEFNRDTAQAQRWLKDNPPRRTPQCYWPLAQALLFQWARLRSVIGSPVRMQMASVGLGCATWGVAKGNTSAMIVFVVDMERALTELAERSSSILKMRSEGMMYPEIARALHVSRPTIERGYPAALDELTEVLLRRRMLKRMPELEAVMADKRIAIAEWVYEAERVPVELSAVDEDTEFGGYDDDWKPENKDGLHAAAVRELADRFAPAHVRGVNRVAWAKGFIAGWNNEERRTPYADVATTTLLRRSWDEGYVEGESQAKSEVEPEFVPLTEEALLGVEA